MIYPQLDAANYPGPTATFKTNKGDITVKLFADVAPKTVENFVTHAKNGYYDNQIFHRVIKDFMLQGGDPTGTGMGGESIWGGSFADEFSPNVFNMRGALSMANAGPNTNGSQFFIVQATGMLKSMKTDLRNSSLPEEVVKAYVKGGTPWLDGKHTVFGQVVSGMDTVDDIAAVGVDMYDKPTQDVVIETITISD
jgi:peptidyl-prolyl cis-trans isomerase B (cyclophilin B)